MLTRNDSVEYYEGDSFVKSTVSYCSYNNLRSLIQQKQNLKFLGDRPETILIIYPGKESTYKNFMDILDEVQINDVRHYFIMD